MYRIDILKHSGETIEAVHNRIEKGELAHAQFESREELNSYLLDFDAPISTFIVTEIRRIKKKLWLINISPIPRM